MVESENSGNIPEWKLKDGGGFERIYRGKFGERVIEDWDLSGKNLIRRGLIFDDAIRFVANHFEEPITDLSPVYGNILLKNEESLWMEAYDPWRYHEKLFVFFGNLDRTYDGQYYTDVDLSPMQLGYSSDTGNISFARFQAEIPKDSRKERQEMENELKKNSWVENIGLMVNYLLTDTERKVRPSFRTYPSNISQANLLFDRILNAIAPDDRNSIIKLLKESYLLDRIERELADQAQEKGVDLQSLVLDSEEEDKIMDKAVYNGIDIPWPKVYQQFLEVVDFGENDFQWEEIEVESSWGGEVPDVWDIKRKNRDKYGDEIEIQNNKFIIKREGNEVKVSCLDNKGNTRWQSLFPLSVPITKIQDIFSDQNSDFRKLRTLLGVNLKIKS